MIRIAVVEDEDKEIECLRSGIETYFGEVGEEHSVDVFHDGMEFIDACRGKYDIVFMDIEMPLLNGYKTAQKLREKDADAAIIVLARTGGEGADYTQDMRADKKGNPNGYVEYSTAEQNHTSVKKRPRNGDVAARVGAQDTVHHRQQRRDGSVHHRERHNVENGQGHAVEGADAHFDDRAVRSAHGRERVHACLDDSAKQARQGRGVIAFAIQDIHTSKSGGPSMIGLSFFALTNFG